MTTTDTALAATVQARIAVLWRQRQRDRRSAYRAEWNPARQARETELRALLRLVRSARRLARGMEQADPLTASKAYRELGYHGAQAVYR